MLKLNKISKFFNETCILDNLSLTLPEGTFAYLTGSSGSGKSTLLSILAGDLIPDEGQVIFQGVAQDFSNEQNLQKYKKSVQLVEQFSSLDAHFTLLENCLYFLLYRRMKKELAQKEALEMLESLNIGYLADSFPASISGGELARANLAQVLLLKPQILLLDEITANLDFHHSMAIIKILEEQNQQGTTIFMATHDEEVWKNFPHTRYNLREGEIYEI